MQNNLFEKIFDIAQDSKYEEPFVNSEKEEGELTLLTSRQLIKVMIASFSIIYIVFNVRIIYNKKKSLARRVHTILNIELLVKVVFLREITMTTVGKAAIGPDLI